MELGGTEALHFEAIETRLRRWAEELHDETLQSIGAVRMRLAAARRGDPEQLDQAVGEALDELGGQILALRSLIGELRPAALDELGLVPALEDLAARGSAAGLEVTFEPGPGSGEALGPELETLLFRIAQEALENASAHAPGAAARLSLRRGIGTVVLAVADDGPGFEPARPHAGAGLASLRRRAAVLGGSLRVSSAPAAGTVVHACLPLRGPGVAQSAARSSRPRSSA